MSGQPSVSVVVAARDAEATIGECVRSLGALRYPPERLELVVVDNGSRDRTARAAREACDRVTVLHEAVRGAGAARNAGIAHAGGEVVAFTDADCVVDPDWLAQLVPAVADRSVGAAGGTILARRPANSVERFGEAIHDHRTAIEVYRPPYVITMSWASRRALLRELGGFDNRFLRGQDTDLAYRIVEAGYRLAFAPGAVVYHRNESTLRGLLAEGFVHGYHGVRVRKRHEAFLRELGHGRVGVSGYAAIWSGVRRPGDSAARCQAVFNLGKKAGKALGSARFRHLDL